MTITAHVVEPFDFPRLIVLNVRQGSFSFHLDEALEIASALLAAHNRALDPSPLHFYEAPPHTPSTSLDAMLDI